MYTLYWGFRKFPFTLYTYALAKMLQNRAKFIQKLTPGFKNHMRNFDNFRQAVESSKKWNLMDKFWPKNTFVQKMHSLDKKLYTEDLSKITSKYLCENSPYYLCHFWNHNSLFTTQLPCTFLTQRLHTFYKRNPSKCKVLDFPLLGLKFTKFLVSFFKQKVSFPSKFPSFWVTWKIILLYF